MQQRIYIVNDKQANASRLVRAGNPAQALRHVAHARFDVKAANALEVADLMGSGVELEKSTDAPDQLSLAEPALA